MLRRASLGVATSAAALRRGLSSAAAADAATAPTPTPTPAKDKEPKDPGLATRNYPPGLTPTPKVEGLLDEIMRLNLLEVAMLVEGMKKRLNLPDVNVAMLRQGMAAPAGGTVPAGGAAAEKKDEKKAEKPAEPAKTTFDVKLESFDAGDKIKIIKEVRGITGLGLKEAKDLVEGVPKVIGTGLSKADADAMLEKLKAAGGKVVLV